MKKIVLFTLMLSLNLLTAQSLFDKYEDYDTVTSVIVTEEMFKLLKEIDLESEEAKEEIDILSSLTSLKVFSVEDASTSQKIINDAKKYIQKQKMVELMRINDKDNKVRFYFIKGNKPHIARELIMIVEPMKNNNDDTVVMLVTGDIDLKKLSKLNNKVKVIDSKYLKKVEAAQKE